MSVWELPRRTMYVLRAQRSREVQWHSGPGEEIWKQGGGFIEVNSIQHYMISYPIRYDSYKTKIIL